MTAFLLAALVQVAVGFGAGHALQTHSGSDSQQLLQPATAHNSSASLADCGVSIDGGGWQLVRHTAGSGNWGPFTDGLKGTETYSNAGTSTDSSHWTVTWNINEVYQFLFATGNCNTWLIAEPSAVGGKIDGNYYSNSERTVYKSSSKSYTHNIKWYNRADYSEDPWISKEDHTVGPLHNHASMLYGQGSGSYHTSLKNSNSGVNVYVRGPTPAPTPSPTPAPTSSPTTSPTASPAASSQGAPASPQGASAQAIGDPHLRNIHGSRFDLMHPGEHSLLHIPREAAVGNALLRVTAQARQMGARCADVYFQELNITGMWAERKQAGGFHFLADTADCKGHSTRMSFETLDLKVVNGCTLQDVHYINFYVQHLSTIRMTIGGLLGEDDHAAETIPSPDCSHHMSFHSYLGAESDVASFAEAHMA